VKVSAFKVVQILLNFLINAKLIETYPKLMTNIPLAFIASS